MIALFLLTEFIMGNDGRCPHCGSPTYFWVAAEEQPALACGCKLEFAETLVPAQDLEAAQQTTEGLAS